MSNKHSCSLGSRAKLHYTVMVKPKRDERVTKNEIAALCIRKGKEVQNLEFWVSDTGILTIRIPEGMRTNVNI